MRERSILPIPNVCDTCKSVNIRYTFNGQTIHNPNKRFGVWVCEEHGCNAMATTPHGSQNPHGYMATRDIRKLRMELHDIFDRLWKRPGAMWKRDDAYEWLAVALEVPLNEANISRLSKENLLVAIGLCTDKVKEHMRITIRRQEKKVARQLRKEIAEQHRNKIAKNVRVGSAWKNPIGNEKRQLRYKVKDDN